MASSSRMSDPVSTGGFAARLFMVSMNVLVAWHTEHTPGNLTIILCTWEIDHIWLHLEDCQRRRQVDHDTPIKKRMKDLGLGNWKRYERWNVALGQEWGDCTEKCCVQDKASMKLFPCDPLLVWWMTPGQLIYVINSPPTMRLELGLISMTGRNEKRKQSQKKKKLRLERPLDTNRFLFVKINE